MTIYFIGAGPGAADLITLRGAKLIQKCPVCLYAGSLVPKELIATAPKNALIKDSSGMVLDEIITIMQTAHRNNQHVARVHSGDPSIYGAIGEQMRRLDYLNIPYEICPGVPAFAAAAAVLKKELTLSDISQTIILTRTSVRSSPMPIGEELCDLAKTKATLVIHLSINNLAKIVRQLIPHYGKDCPVAVIYRASWQDEKIITGELQNIRTAVKSLNLTRTALILVGHVLNPKAFADSKLYDPNHWHVLRPKKLKNK